MLFRGVIVFNAFFLVTEFIDYFNWFVFAQCLLVAFVSYVQWRTQDLQGGLRSGAEWPSAAGASIEAPQA